MKKNKEEIGQLKQQLEELEKVKNDDIVKFKKILRLDPVNYLTYGDGRGKSLGTVRAFREAQQIAKKRLIDLGILEEGK